MNERRQVWLRFWITRAEHDGRYTGHTKSGGIYWDLNPQDIEELPPANATEAISQFNTLFKKNGELQTEIGRLQNEVANLEDQLHKFEHLRDLWKEVMG